MRMFAGILLLCSVGCATPVEKMHRAVVEGDVDAVQSLLAKDPSLATREWKGRPPILETKSAKVAEVLLGAGVQLDARTGSDAMAAARSGEMVEFLVARGVKVDTPIGACMTNALYTATSGDGVEALVRHGLDPRRVDKCSRTALHKAAPSKEPWVTEVVRALVAAGADVNARAGKRGADRVSGYTPLYRASALGIAALVGAGADVEAHTDDGETALMRASLDNDLERAEALLKAGANPNVRLPPGARISRGWDSNDAPGLSSDASNQTALSLAGSTKMADLLAKAGATK